MIRKKKWTKEVIIIESEKNKGLANSVIGGITDVINKHGKAIVLDDDQLVSKGFLKYMNTALALYEKEERVMQISGYVFPFAKPFAKTHSSYFIPVAASTAWATWKRAWDKFDAKAEGYEKLLTDKELSYRFDVDGVFHYTRIMIDQMQKKEVDSWAIRWWWSVFINEGLALSPDKSLAQYIPSGDKATHVTGNDLPFTHDQFDKAYFIEKYPDKVIVDERYFGEIKKAFVRIINFNAPPPPKFSAVVFLKAFFRKALGDSLFEKVKTIVRGSNEQMQQKKETERLSKYERYVPATTRVLGKEIRLTDAASFLFIYDELFNKNIYKFKAATDKPYIIDCGANIGLSIIYFKHLFPGASILGFEPDPGSFKVLSYNIAQFGFSDVEVIEKAVWKNEDTLNFFSEGADGGRIALESDKTKIREVKSVRLKNYLDRRVDFLKIDIEGAEATVLKDCGEALKNVDRMFVEYHSFTDQPQSLDELLNILSTAGFRYNIQHVGIFSSTPFVKINSSLNMDNQLNIFAYR